MLQGLNSSMIAVALVAIAADFGNGPGITWVISALYIATAVSAPTAGRLGVLVGPRKLFLGGLALVAVGSLVGALAPSLGWLIAGRVILGIGTAAQYPTAMTIVRSIATRTGGETRSALAILTVCAQTMVALGPTVGGVLVGLFGWQSILWINIPIVLVSAVWVLWRVPRDDALAADAGEPAPSSLRALVHSMDLPGMALFLLTVSGAMFVLLSLTTDPLWWLAPGVVLVAVAFVVWEARVREPFIDVRAIAGNTALAATLSRTLVTYTAFYCIFFGLPQWLQVSRGFSTSQAGLLMLPVAGVGIIGTIVASRMYATAGPKWTLGIGTAALAVGGVLLMTLENAATPVVALVAVACVLGIPNGFNNMGNQNVVNAVTTVRDVGTALGLYRMIQYIGANLAAVVIALATHDVGPGDQGIARIGAFIAVVGVVLLVGVIASRSLRGLRPRHTSDSPGVHDREAHSQT
ncbi:MFS transporter [Rhodococcus rhodnii]|nr:MFS transporter [Rhodococcus rhodnii]TXG92280.1 MFS transporter [Rhodococcus rhodnii]